ncbi:hypothetical protein [Paraburkholderia sp. PGU19]|uniref:hypothetical protein n=1 Tax=Paraburkholderia sp. PGU19 TaxID=2735434 RepID=UPI0015DABB59|nr:hypothetical protein [Paraburkholderia sp. PGU19]
MLDREDVEEQMRQGTRICGASIFGSGTGIRIVSAVSLGYEMESENSGEKREMFGEKYMM